MKILVVDDEINICHFLQKHLSGRGYEVGYATRGEDALEHIAVDPPNMVLLDIRMPGMGGVELLARIRQKSPDIAVVMVTAVYEEELGRQCLKLGALDYITKPIDLRYLETSILSGLHGGGSR